MLPNSTAARRRRPSALRSHAPTPAVVAREREFSNRHPGSSLSRDLARHPVRRAGEKPLRSGRADPVPWRNATRRRKHWYTTGDRPAHAASPMLSIAAGTTRHCPALPRLTPSSGSVPHPERPWHGKKRLRRFARRDPLEKTKSMGHCRQRAAATQDASSGVGRISRNARRRSYHRHGFTLRTCILPTGMQKPVFCETVVCLRLCSAGTDSS